MNAASYQVYLNLVEGNDGVSLIKGSSGSLQVLNGYCSEQFRHLSRFLLLSLLGDGYLCFIANHNTQTMYTIKYTNKNNLKIKNFKKE